MEPFINDDYASLAGGRLDFYYGYEYGHEMAKLTGVRRTGGDWAEDEWGFIVKVDGKLVYHQADPKPSGDADLSLLRMIGEVLSLPVVVECLAGLQEAANA